jgi:DNA-directed RNA polymerase specialized sigma24 family protein
MSAEFSSLEHTLTLDDLFRRAQTGDAAALEAYCQAVRGGLILVVKFNYPDFSQETRDDIVQDSLTTFVEKIREINESPQGFLLKILYYNLGSELRRRGVDRKRLDNGDIHTLQKPVSPKFEDDIERHDLIAACIRTIDHMREPERTLLRKTFGGENRSMIYEWYRQFDPYANYEAFRKRLYRARQELWKRLEGQR